MSERVSFRVDLTTGVLEVDAPLDSLEEVLERVEAFIPHLADAQANQDNPPRPAQPAAKRASTPSVEQKEDGSTKPKETKAAKSGQGKRSRRTAALGIVSDLDLRPEGKKSLRAFHEEKSPGTNEKRFAVIIYYFKKILEVDAVTLNHMYTALKDLGQKVPTRLSTVMSNSASRHGWIDAKDKEDIKITIHGENFVEHDLPEHMAVNAS